MPKQHTLTPPLLATLQAIASAPARLADMDANERNRCSALADRRFVEIDESAVSVTESGLAWLARLNSTPKAVLLAALQRARPWVDAAIQGPISHEDEMRARSDLEAIDDAIAKATPSLSGRAR